MCLRTRDVTSNGNIASCLEHHDGTCNRWVTVETELRLGVPLKPEEARQPDGQRKTRLPAQEYVESEG
jgi:hypothetical protein